MTLQDEIKTAREKYGAFNSTHEVYGVLVEEVDEFFQVVKLPNHPQQTESKSVAMISELKQIAAISLRAIDELKKGDIRWV